jgi:hypothetical protein
MSDTKEPEVQQYTNRAYTGGSEATLPGEVGGLAIFDFEAGFVVTFASLSIKVVVTHDMVSGNGLGIAVLRGRYYFWKFCS